MPDFFHLDLDTTSPELTWGTISGVGRDRVLIARYTVDEPGVVAAQFIDAANVTTDLTVYADRVTGRIPADAAYGQGVIRAWLQDEVGNTAVRSVYVSLLAPTAHIELDTTPPVVTWGPVSGTDATEDFTVLYALNEPALASADLRLPDGRVLPMQVQPDRLIVTLPADTPDGLATVEAHVLDDVGNSATRTLVVVVTGVASVRPLAPRVGGMPTPTFRPRLVTSGVSGLGTSSDAAADVVARPAPTRVVVRSHYLLASQVAKMLIEGVGVSSRDDQVAAVLSAPSATLASAHFSIRRTLEGARAEEELLLLLDVL